MTSCERPRKRKLVDAHCCDVRVALCALGGTRFFMVMGDGMDLCLWLNADAVGHRQLPTPTVCVRSFIAARKAREAAA